MTSLPDNFDYSMWGVGTKTPFVGYISAKDPTVVGPGAMIGGSQNMVLALSGGIFNRPGLKRRGTPDSTLSGVKASFDWNNSTGDTVPLRVIQDIETGMGKLQFESSIADGTTLVWYDLLTGLVESRFVFDTWWDSTNSRDVCLFVDGIDSLFKWSGAVAKMASADNASGYLLTFTNPEDNILGDSGGTGYVVGDILTISGGTAQLTVRSVTTGGASGVSLGLGGSGYVVGDYVRISGATGTVKPIVRVDTVSGGAITGITLVTSGEGNGTGSTLATVAATGVGTGATISIDSVAAGSIKTWRLTSNGSGYSASTFNATTGGTGTGASVHIETIATGGIVLEETGIWSDYRFPSGAGSVQINGTSYAYQGGSDTNVLVGVSPDASLEPAGSVVINEVTENLNTPIAGSNNDFLRVVNNQVHIGSYTSQNIRISSATDYTNYTVPAVRTVGSPDLIVIGSPARGITVQKGTSDIAGSAVVSGSEGDWYTIQRAVQTSAQLNSSDQFVSTITETVTVIKTQSADLSAAQGHEFIDLIGDNIIFLDQNNQLREFAVVRNIINPVFPTLSLEVYTELSNRDFTGGALRVVADENDTTVYLTCPAEGIDYMYHVRQNIDEVGNLRAERFWDTPQVRGISRIAVIGGIAYGYSNSNPQMYQLWNTDQYYDDGPFDAEELPYACHLVFGYFSLHEYGRQFNFDKQYFEGYMTRGTILYESTYLDYQGSTNILTSTINKATIPGKRLAALFGAMNTPVPGESVLGNIEIGDGILPPSTGSVPLPKFRAIRHIASTDVFEATIDIFSEDLDAQWGILRAGVNMTPSDSQPTGIMGITNLNR